MALIERWVRTDGDDGNDGTTAALAWATIDKAAQQDFSGNADGADIYIAPGTYRESPVVDYAGATPGAGRGITRFIGDPENQHFGAYAKPGRVRVTTFAVDTERAATATAITTNVAYVEWHRLHIEASINASSYSVVAKAADATSAVHDCHLQGTMLRGAAYRCVGQDQTIAFSTNALTRNCLALGSTNGGFNSVTAAYNCAAFVFGSGYGFRSCGCYNCVVFCSSTGFRTCTGTDCYARSCTVDVFAGDLAPTSSYYTDCTTINLFTQGAGFVMDLAPLRELLPYVAIAGADGILRSGDNTTPAFGATDVDISGHRLRLKGSGLDIGPWSIPTPTDFPPVGGQLDWATYETTPPSIQIDTEGDVLLTFAAKSGVAVTVTVQSYHDTIGAGDKPQLVLRGDSITEQTDTNAAADQTWDLLTVSATPSFDEVLTIVLRARNAAGTCYFSDLAVSA